MLRVSYRRSTSSRWLRALLLLSTVIVFIDLLSLILTRRSQSVAHKTKPPNVQGQRIFIASIHWNNEYILRSNWNEAVVNLVKYFGPENVYISIHESGSYLDDTKGALRELDGQLEGLGVKRMITLDETTHADEMRKPIGEGWIDTPRGRKELRRIPYLSRLRNISLRPLKELASEGIKFDKVLFLNDVVFTVSQKIPSSRSLADEPIQTEDVANLLATRDGDYAAACSLDFSKSSQYYDTFALRDSDGHEAATPSWPYFRSKSSRDAMISGQPVPVQSCWNGIIAFDAVPFYEPDPLVFRGISDSLAAHHLEGSECCLIHADNPLSSTHGVWLNPDVRVGYGPEAYDAVHPGALWPSTTYSIVGIWKTRITTWLTTPYFKASKINSRLEKWRQADSGRNEPGVQCLINEMQTVIENGWAHV